MIVNLFTLLVLISSGMCDRTNLNDFHRDGKTISYKHAIALTQVIDLAKRKLEAWEPPDHLKNIIEFAKAVVTSARWVLMKIRKLGGAHPAELKLTKCLGKYFKSKIISLKRKLIEYPDKKNQKSGENDEPQRPDKEMMKLERESEDMKEFSTDKKCEGKKEFCLGKIERIRNVKRRLLKFKDLIYGYFQEYLLRNGFLICTWEYVLKKFWSWVDSAPDLKNVKL